uniref:HAD-like protein n=1 Tax=Globodera pallida TaxID=36090 RepID=A0A183C5E0_GLOPA
MYAIRSYYDPNPVKLEPEPDWDSLLWHWHRVTVAKRCDQKTTASNGSDKKVYMIGGQGIKDEMDELDIDHFGDGPDPVDEQPASKGSAFLYELELEEKMERVGAVVVGYEKYFNYLKLMKAANYLRNEDCLFVATNEDETCPGPNPETVIPDAGPLVAAVRTASGRDPHVVGKPNTPAFDYICRRWTIDPRRTLMVGDRLNTDVKFGNDHGLRTMLVLSGCHGVGRTIEKMFSNLMESDDSGWRKYRRIPD